MQSKNWIGTINNPTHTEFDEFLKRPYAGYAVWQLERGASGTMHYQFYVEFSNKVRRNVLSSYFPHSFLEPRRGTQAEAIGYCTKEDTRVAGPWSLGTASVSEQGSRKDLDSIAAAVLSGTSLKELAQENPGAVARYSKGLGQLEQWQQQRWRDVRCVFIAGPEGTGKSSFVFDHYGYDNVYALASSKPLWFNGYHGQRVLLIDEFAQDLDRKAFLRMLDGHPFLAEVKGGFVPARWTVVFIVANDWYYDAFTPEQKRRFQGAFWFDRKRGEYKEVSEWLEGRGDRPNMPFGGVRVGGLLGAQQ